MTVNPPIKGATAGNQLKLAHGLEGWGYLLIGPRKISVANIVSAVLRDFVSNMSAYTEAVRATGAEPKTAMKKRDIKSVCMSLHVADAVAKTLKPNKPIR